MIEVTIQAKPGDDVPQTWYGTFGGAHPNGGRFFVIEDATYSEAREHMFDLFGTLWAFIYSESEWTRDGLTQEERYGLVRIP